MFKKKNKQKLKSNIINLKIDQEKEYSIKKQITKPIIKKRTESKKRKIVIAILETVFYILIFLLIAWGTPAGLKIALKTDYPIAAITSSSMWPILKQGDIVLIKGVYGKENVEVGDIVVYNNSEESQDSVNFTIHRIVQKEEDSFITKGDANNTEDIPVEYDKLIGKTVNYNAKPVRIPILGKLSQIFNK